MKKIFAFVVALISALTVQAQSANFQTVKGNGFTLHIYNSGDVMADASYIVEGNDGLVTLEEPLFKDGAAAFNAYLTKLGKPVAARIVDYHEGGTGNNPLVQPEGMPKFMHEGVYDAMMKSFQQSFGDKMVDLPTGQATEVAFGETATYAGVTFTFFPGPKNDFPAAGILIGKDFYLSHWAPGKTHMNALQLAGKAAVAQALEGWQIAKASGSKYFLGGHGGCADLDALNFRIGYLKTIAKLLEKDTTAEAFVSDLKAAYPGLAGEDGLAAMAANLYK